MWMSHHLWHENITFLKLNNAELVHEHLQSHTLIGVFIALALFLSAAAKSAQLPFSSGCHAPWKDLRRLPRFSMSSIVGPLGVFLMLRTYPFWGTTDLGADIYCRDGAIPTSLVATGIARCSRR